MANCWSLCCCSEPSERKAASKEPLEQLLACKTMHGNVCAQAEEFNYTGNSEPAGMRGITNFNEPPGPS
eukprot:5694922-Amphidinium_carterae.1